MSLTDEVAPLLAERKFEEVEARWMARLESGETADVDQFLATAKMLRKLEERQRADALLGLLADALLDQKAWPERLKVLREIARLTRQPSKFAKQIEEAVTHTYGDRPSFKKVMAAVKFSEANANPVEKADRLENALNYDEGKPFFMAGRGVGVVTELNLELGVCRLDFEKEKRVSVPIGAAPRFLVALPEGHILRGKIDDPERLRKRVVGSPAESFAEILQSFGRPMTAAEVKDTLTGILPETRWNTWWTAARKHPQIVVSGSGAKASYAWSASTEAAEGAIRKDFEHATARAKLELARKHSGRSQELADFFSAALTREAERQVRSDPALAWEILTSLEKLPGRYEKSIEPSELLGGSVAARTVAAIPDRQLRERAVREVRDTHPEWPKVFGELFFLEDDPKVLSLIMEMLEPEHSEVADRLVEETLRYPRRHTRAFYWYCKTLSDAGELPEKNEYGLLFQILDAIGSEEFGPLRARLKEFFDRGGLGVQIVQKSDNEEQARKLMETLERYGLLEEYRRDNVRNALLMKYPALREPQAEPLYATAETLEAKRAELENLRKVEIPANLKALQHARELGDLSENFEYKSARQRAEYLSARVAQLQGELNRVLLIDPKRIDTSVIRIGARVTLRNGDERREVIILGQWESAPEQGIFSSEADAAKALLGRTVGDIVTFMGNDYEVAAIDRWK
jgi:transcription elongation GreA/GreB family factor